MRRFLSNLFGLKILVPEILPSKRTFGGIWNSAPLRSDCVLGQIADVWFSRGGERRLLHLHFVDAPSLLRSLRI